MKLDSVRKYIELRDSLLKERDLLQERLRQIDEALGAPAPAAPPEQAAVVAPSGRATGSRRGRPPRGGISLREAVLRATANGPLTKQEILDAVKAMGYKFSTKDPMNSLGVVLYGKNPRFKNEGGRFSPAGTSGQTGGGGSQQASVQDGGPFVRKKRQLSPEARERIAAAQRARWAKAKGM